MSWSVSRSWQADELVSTACNVGSDLFIANGLSITLLDEELNHAGQNQYHLECMLQNMHLAR